MAAYAIAERLARSAQLNLVVDRQAQQPSPALPAPESAGLDVVLGHLADLVAERLAARLTAPTQDGDDWLDTRAAAAYLGVHRDTIRRLAAERVVPSEQEGPGCKLFFRRSDLDAWRCSGRVHVRVLSGGRS